MWFRSYLRLPSKGLRRAPMVAAAGAVLAIPAVALLPPWLRGTVAGSAAEAALFRAMSLPGVSVLFPRPPAESVAELNHLVSAEPTQPRFLLLRSHQEEAALDMPAAERDLKAYIAQVPADRASRLALVDFYHRRHAPEAEFTTLLEVGSASPVGEERFQPPLTQMSWQAFERALRLATDESLSPASFDTLWQQWLARYPQQPTLYARAFTWNLNRHREAEAQAILDRYRQAFPSDATFPVKASALLVLSSGGQAAQDRAVEFYNSAFQPLWPQELVNSYFDLLAATHNTRRFVADAEARLQRSPDDLNALARLFLYDRHDGHPELAASLLDSFRLSKEQRDASGKNWSPDDLYTLAQLCTGAQLYPEAARYDFALYHQPGTLANGRSAQQLGLAGTISLLLTAPDQPIAFGSSNLSMYRDIATADDGPGFWNGILSLWLNDQDIEAQFADEEEKAQPYFHRSAAAALLQQLDRQEPSASERPALHAQLIDVYADYGEDAVLLQEGERFLQDFPNAPQRTAVALSMADADARAKNTVAEFALYDRLLGELGRTADNMPLSAAANVKSATTPGNPGLLTDDSAAPPGTTDSSQEVAPSAARTFDLDTGDPSLPPNPAATAYAEVLDRYLGRLTATDQLPQALAVLRKELDRNPNDPRLYERLADFLRQNNLSAQQEEVYRAAIAKFDTAGDTSWYDKLARFYLREKRRDAFAALTWQVTDIFSGTELDAYFSHVSEGGPQLFLQLNLYAHHRFPHDLVFTDNLLGAYTTKPTADHSAWEHLLRESWWQSPELTTRFFGWLSETGQLDNEVAQLEAQAGPGPSSSTPDTASLTESGQADLWRSHFEQGSPVFDQLAELYPADQGIGSTAADLHRSLAWLDPAGPSLQIEKAVRIEEHLLTADAADSRRLTLIGDILADHADGTRASYAASAAFWRRIPALEPGDPASYLDSATVFWDYFQFDDALHEINLARTHFNNSALFSYEAGAILEGKRDLAGAIDEYVRATLAGSRRANGATSAEEDKEVDLPFTARPNLSQEITTDPAADRLLQLARRPVTAALVDHATAATLDTTPGLPALRLRLAVLDAQHRKAEQQPLLLAAISRANTTDAAGDLAAFAQKQADTSAYEAALRREAELTPDPVEKLQLTYDLVRAYQARNDLSDAAHLVDATYKANPRVLGVVRFTVDFDWSNQRKQEAVKTLLDAAQAARPQLAQQFTAEAAARANESGDTALARSLANTLLASEPYNPQFLALAAESYTKANDLSGLESFYRARLAALSAVGMTTEERRARTALLRRGLIPALVAGKDYPAALDQYIALLSTFPEDGALVQEAALFALRYAQQDKLRSFYLQTTQSSPRDARFFVALAQTDDMFGNPAGSLAAYTQAAALRPGQADLYVAKTSLEERLGRFDAAVADYKRLFQLSYKDPQWMTAAAKAQVQQGHTAAAVESLETAYLHGNQTTPHDLFTVAAQLEQWGLLPQAAVFAERGAKLAGPDLLAGQPPSVGSDDPAVYARILTRLRRTGEAFTTLRLALTGPNESPSSLPALAAQVRSSGLASVTDAEWRRTYVLARQKRAQAQYTQAILAISQVIAAYGTPEDRIGYAAMLSDQRSGATPQDVSQRWIPAARAADLGELEAAWRAELLNGSSPGARQQLQPYTELQEARLRFGELGAELERFAAMHSKSDNHAETVREAAKAYAAAGETPAQLRLLGSQRLGDPNNVPLRDTYLELLANRDSNALIALAHNGDPTLADAAVATALAAAPPATALSAIRSRGTALPALWTAWYTGLGGLYLADRSGLVDAAFRQALAPDATIGERLSLRPGTGLDPQQQVKGDLWFYGAARYAQWRLLSPTLASTADDLLAADLEGAATPANYLALAQTESEGGLPSQALLDTAHALELAPGSVDALDARAQLLWNGGRKAEAVDCWRSALLALRFIQEKGPVPESFWTGFERIAARVQQYALFPQVQPAMADLLRSYLARNGSYRSNELLRAAMEAAPNEKTGVAFTLAVSSAASNAVEVIEDLANDTSLSLAVQKQLLAQALNRLEAQPSATSGPDYGSYRLAQLRRRLLDLYIHDYDDAEALALIQASPATVRGMPVFQRAALIAAARSGHLASLLKTYDEPTVTVPASDTVRSAAASLAEGNDWSDARTLLEWNFTRAESLHTLSSSDYLTLAEAQLHTQDNAGALELLRSLVTSSQDRYTDEDAAATLLEEAHLPAETIAFLKELSAAVPWDLSYGVRLAEAQADAKAADHPELAAAAIQNLTSIAKNGLAPYALRARAARDLASVHARTENLGSGELNLLASGPVSPGLARQPLFAQARIAAGETEGDNEIRGQLLREAVAIEPHAPDADRLRFQLFELSAQTRRTAFARAVLAQLLASQNVYSWPPPQRLPRAGLLQYAELKDVSQDQTFVNGPAMPVEGQLKSKAEQATLAEEIARISIATDDLPTARSYLQLAEELLPSQEKSRSRVASELSSLEAQMRLATANQLRRPVVRQQLDQPAIVRVLLTTPPPGATPTPMEER